MLGVCYQSRDRTTDFLASTQERDPGAVPAARIDPDRDAPSPARDSTSRRIAEVALTVFSLSLE